MTAPRKNARAIAAQILAQVLPLDRKNTHPKSLSELLPQLSEADKDQGLVQELCFGVCRWFTRLDKLAAPLIRQPLFVPMSRGTLDLLADMRQKRVHLAIVLDEYFGTEGLVTIEDLIEEIIGDIEDEHDDAPAPLLIPIDGGGWEADGRAELEDVGEAIDPRLAETDDDIDTIGGLAAVLAGQVPEAGARITHPSGWRFEVIEADTKRIIRLRLHPPADAEAITD